MSTPVLDKFLAEINQILKARNADRLREYLVIEPPLPDLYNAIVNEIRRSYPPAAQNQLEKKCEHALPEYSFDDGAASSGSWGAFNTFLVHYFSFLRDVNPEQLVETHEKIKSLLSHSVLALSDAVMGIVVLPAVIQLSKILSKLSIGLEKHPELLASMTRRKSISADAADATEKVTLVESSANTIREAFSKCLSERAGNIKTGLTAEGRPEGRRIGIYQCANLCLRLFFHCNKLRSAEQIFGNIYQQSPPLEVYPASQRVTFLYYLGRYHFANNHLFRALRSLQAAYDQCHIQALKQRRCILIRLISANVCVGRFPSQTLLSRPEAVGLGEVFVPLCQAIRQGNLTAFRDLTSLNSPIGDWMLRHRILFIIQNSVEVLVWRSLARRTFMLSGFQPGPEGENSKRAPLLDLEILGYLVNFLEGKARGARESPYIDDDFEGVNDYDYDHETNGVLNGVEGADGKITNQNVSMADVESGIASLAAQELLNGYVSHRHMKLAIKGAKGKSALAVGFPAVWPLLSSRFANDEVPGWVHEGQGGLSARAKSGGQVIRRSNLTPVGLG